MLGKFELLRSERRSFSGCLKIRPTQETYSSPDVENLWKTQWKGDLYFAHGSELSRGVLILVKESFNLELKSCTHDKQGRYIILRGNVQEQPFVFANIYAPNKTTEQCTFSRRFKLSLIV